VQVLEQSAATIATQLQTTRKETTAALEEARSSLSGRMMWISGGAGALSALLLVVGMAIFRPGWTMSPTQREQIEVGRSAMHQYERADAKRRAEILRVMRWIVPAETPPPSASPRPRPAADPES
jgi:hypothetical protein